MGTLDFIAKMTQVLIWPVAVAVLAWVMYLNRGKGGSFFGDLLGRLRQLEVGSVKVFLAESKATPPLSADVKNGLFKRYTNGLIVQRFSFSSVLRVAEFPLTFPTTFPNEVLSFQFVGAPSIPIKSFTNSGVVLDLTGCKTPLKVEIIITGM